MMPRIAVLVFHKMRDKCRVNCRRIVATLMPWRTVPAARSTGQPGGLSGCAVAGPHAGSCVRVRSRGTRYQSPFGPSRRRNTGCRRRQQGTPATLVHSHCTQCRHDIHHARSQSAPTRSAEAFRRAESPEAPCCVTRTSRPASKRSTRTRPAQKPRS